MRAEEEIRKHLNELKDWHGLLLIGDLLIGDKVKIRQMTQELEIRISELKWVLNEEE